jgi:hypothetical protein
MKLKLYKVKSFIYKKKSNTLIIQSLVPIDTPKCGNPVYQMALPYSSLEKAEKLFILIKE